jgi:hypothetical protein
VVLTSTRQHYKFYKERGYPINNIDMRIADWSKTCSEMPLSEHEPWLFNKASIVSFVKIPAPDQLDNYSKPWL